MSSISGKKLAFLGAGNMGSALIEGALDSGMVRSGSITVFDVKRETLSRIRKKTGVRTATSVRDAMKGADTIFLCVKPQQMGLLLREVADWIKTGQCLVSIAAGVTTRRIERHLPGRNPVIRAMPNTPAMIRCGMTVVTRGRFAGKSHERFAMSFFATVGKVMVLPERYFDAVTAISGSGPAYLFHLAESFEEACRALKLPRSGSEILFKQTLLGAGMMLADSRTPAELRKQVTSPGGTTESALRYLDSRKWSRIFVEAVKKARDRSRQLSG